MIAGARQSRWIVGLFVLSVAANLFFAGMLVARHVMPPHGRHDRMARLVHELTADLPEADRDAARRAFAARQAEIGERFAAVERSRDELRDAIAEPVLDRPALRKALADAQDAELELLGTLQELLFETATELSPEGRRKLAAARPLRGSPAR